MTPEMFDLMGIACSELFRGNVNGKLWVITANRPLGEIKSLKIWHWDEELQEYIHDSTIQVTEGDANFLYTLTKLAYSHIGCPKPKGTTLTNWGNIIPTEIIEESLAEQTFLDW